MKENERKQMRSRIDFVKRAFKLREVLGKMPSVDYEWERFASEYADELDALEDKHTPLHLQWRKMAAAFIGFLFITGITIAAIHIVRNSDSQQQPAVQSEMSVADIQPTATADTLKNDTTLAEPRIFADVTLDVMLAEIANAYHCEIEFQNEQASQLRFYFVWKREDSLERVVEKLNNFKAVNILVENEKIIVR